MLPGLVSKDDSPVVPAEEDIDNGSDDQLDDSMKTIHNAEYEHEATEDDDDVPPDLLIELDLLSVLLVVFLPPLVPAKGAVEREGAKGEVDDAHEEVDQDQLDRTEEHQGGGDHTQDSHDLHAQVQRNYEAALVVLLLKILDSIRAHLLVIVITHLLSICVF